MSKSETRSKSKKGKSDTVWQPKKGLIFDDDHEQILKLVQEHEPQDKRFVVPAHMAVMTAAAANNDGNITIDAEFAKGDKSKNLRAYVHAYVGMLLNRQMTWGPLFNYPRTLLIGPEVAFTEAHGTARNYYTWRLNLGPSPDGHRVSILDIDQIIWINATSDKDTTNYPRVVEIAVARLNQEQRQGKLLRPTVGYAIVHGGEIAGTDFIKFIQKGKSYTEVSVSFKGVSTSADYEPVAERKITELRKIVAKFVDLGADGGEFVVQYEKEVNGSIETAAKDRNEPGDVADRASVILERVLRDRTSPLEDLLDTKNLGAKADLMYQAFLSGVVPYAYVDLTSDQRQPAVLPGSATIENLAEMVKGLRLKAGEKAAASSVSRGSRGSRTSTSAPFGNPYAAVDAFVDADYMSDP